MSFKYYNHPILQLVRENKQVSLEQILLEPDHQNILNACLVYSLFFNSEEKSFEFIKMGAEFKHNNYEAVRGSVCSGHLNIFKYFIEQGANPFLKDDDHIGYYTSDAAYWGKLNVLKYLIEECGVPFNNDNDSPFRYASYYGHLDCVEYLYNKGVDINAEDGFAITRACEKNQISVVKFLIEKFKYPVLQNICQYGRLETLDIILKNNTKFDITENIMVCSTLNKETDILEYMLDCGGEIHSSKDYLLQTADKNKRFELIDIALDRGMSSEYITANTSSVIHAYLLQKKLEESMMQKNNKSPLVKI
jgi:Ankyrin repeats (3 copies)